VDVKEVGSFGNLESLEQLCKIVYRPAGRTSRLH
jgi:hypothetical protein